MTPTLIPTEALVESLTTTEPTGATSSPTAASPETPTDTPPQSAGSDSEKEDGGDLGLIVGLVAGGMGVAIVVLVVVIVRQRVGAQRQRQPALQHAIAPVSNPAFGLRTRVRGGELWRGGERAVRGSGAPHRHPAVRRRRVRLRPVRRARTSLNLLL